MGVHCLDNHRIQLEYLSSPQVLALNLITPHCARAIASSSALPPRPPQTSHPASAEEQLLKSEYHESVGCVGQFNPSTCHYVPNRLPAPKFSRIHQTVYALHPTKLHSSNNHPTHTITTLAHPNPTTPSPAPCP